VAENLQGRLERLDRLFGAGEVKINISGCMNACGHHHVGNIGLLGVSKNGADWYQITLGGSTGNHTALGKVLGPAVAKQNIGRAIEIIIETYIELRRTNHLSILYSAQAGIHSRSVFMSILINLYRVLEDQWVRLDDMEPIGDAERVIVSVARLRADWERFEHAGLLLGIELAVTDQVADIEDLLARLQLVVLNFDAFADGRAFSQARLLRERFSFQGDIRAQGEVLRDQLSFMQRCGVSQFRLAEREDTELALSAFTGISKNYQPELKVYAG
jgi:uncharacterized protein (DUF934 family)